MVIFCCSVTTVSKSELVNYGPSLNLIYIAKDANGIKIESKNLNVNIQKIYLKNQNDDVLLKKELINQIYAFSEKKIIVVNEIGFSENYLIYIDKIENVSISENSEEYAKYSNLAKLNLTNSMYNTYDNYLGERYKIDINYQAVDTIKNYFN